MSFSAGQERSAALAHALHEWLPTVIQAVEPWMSESDIDRGARWSSDIAAELEEAHVGIICLTPDNMSSPSLHFEAGALSKALDKSLVCTYLLDLEPANLRWPLATFQATRANKEETKQLLTTINKALGEQALPSERLDKAFEHWWPDLAAESESSFRQHRKEHSARQGTSRRDLGIASQSVNEEQTRRLTADARRSPNRT